MCVCVYTHKFNNLQQINICKQQNGNELIRDQALRWGGAVSNFRVVLLLCVSVRVWFSINMG